MSKTVIITGAGMGGLATALRLTSRGYKVHIIEKNHQAGGRLNQLKKEGFTFDTGPSFFSMSYEFEALARDCNMKLPVEYTGLDPLYAVNFKGNPKTFLLYKNLNKLAAQFADEEPDFEQKMRKYLTECSQIFHDTVDIVIKQNFDSLASYLLTLTQVNPVHLPVLFRQFSQQVNHYFSSPEARQIISLVAFFLGRTPFDTSAVYTLLSYTEFRHDGYYNVKGGMYQIVKGMIAELEKRGVTFSFNTEIIGFEAEKNRMKSLISQDGKKWDSDLFVINADAAVFRGNVLKRKAFSLKKLDKKEWTMGYLTIYLGIRCKLPKLHHHHYFLGNNFDEYARRVHRKADLLQQPYYYVNVLSRNNRDCAPDGCESLFFVCPVPDLRYKNSWDDKDQIVDSILRDFSKRIQKDIFPEIITQTVYTPEDWQNQFLLHRGSGLGLSHKMTQIGGFRPKNYDEKFRNVFYVGASTVPGAGLPMAVISSELVTRRIEEFSGKTKQ